MLSFSKVQGKFSYKYEKVIFQDSVAFRNFQEKTGKVP